MGKFIRILLMALGLLVALVLATVVAVIVFVDPNDYREQIGERVHDATGRTLAIGNIDLSLFPWVGLELRDVALGNAQGFDGDFARLENVNVKVKLLPLLRQEVEVSTLVLQGMKLNLQINEQGVSNWSDLAKGEGEAVPAEEKPSAEPAKPPITRLLVGGILIENADVVFDDRQKQARYEVAHFNLRTSEISFAAPFDLAMGFDLASSAPELAAHVDLKSRVALDLDNQKYSASGLALAVDASGKGLQPLKALKLQLGADVAADLKQQTATADALHISALGAELRGKLAARDILGEIKYQAELAADGIDVRGLLKQLGTELKTADSGVLARAGFAAAIDGSLNAVKIDNLRLSLDDTKITGQAAVTDFAKPAVRFDLALDAIDVDRYLPPPAQAETAATQEAPPADPNAPIEFPMETLRGLNIAGGFKAGQVKVANAKLSDVALKIKADQGLIDLDPLSMKLYQGEFAGSVQLDARQDVPAIKVKENLKGVQINPLLVDVLEMDFVEGNAEIVADITTRGNSVAAFKKALNGTARVLVKDGAVKGINLPAQIRKAHAVIKRQPVPEETGPNKTEFSELAASFKIENGVVNNNDLSAGAPMLRVTGSGKADLNTEKLDYMVHTKLVKTLDVRDTGMEELHGVDIPVRITGPFAQPKFDVQLDEILKAKVKAKVEEKKEELKAKASEAVEEKRKEAEQKLKEKAEEKLKNLLRF
ncbi:MAG: AsmA family protein [Pseudomonadota bacterium]